MAGAVVFDRHLVVRPRQIEPISSTGWRVLQDKAGEAVIEQELPGARFPWGLGGGVHLVEAVEHDAPAADTAK